MKDVVPVFLMGGLFVLTYGLALLVIAPFETAGLGVYENPDDPLNVVVFLLTLLVITAVLLLIAKFWKKRMVQVIVLSSIGYIVFYVFYAFLAMVVSNVLSLVFSVAAVAAVIVLLVKYPEWYVINVTGVLLGLGSIAMLGISLSLSLVIILLFGLAVYDAISVYKTKHMIDLADVVLDLKLPVMLVIPKRRSYSLIRDTVSLKEKLKEGEERDAFFMGLGDVVMPGILVASAFHNIGEGGLLVALSVMFGTLLGFAVLMVFLARGKPQAGLPFLCSGAILGYLISSYMLFGELVGFSLPF
ncbi:MAG TPA: presenilin family intramembrane aspartyl protease PSH [Candidatus Bathyarchaeia archaeon]|nr:presenilin family intramembrane aspartyl protease PSH [Candidatus Bathyarchaeia archaeon]